MASAFGLELEAGFPMPGLPPGPPSGGPVTRVRLAPVEGDWDESVRLLAEPELGRTIDHVPGRGYRLVARGFGEATISEDGAEVVCAPPDDEPWSWQRFLVGRVLPWASVLRGFELFHASAVVLGGCAYAFVGATGMGKTSLAARLLLAGGQLLTDDVLALERDGEDIRAHPGAALLCMRPSDRATIGPWLGRVLGESGKIYVEVDRAAAPVPLGGLVFLERHGGPARVTRLESGAGRALLGATFNQSIRTPERLARQLHLCADIGERVPLLSLEVGADADAAAAAILEHVA